MSTDGFNEVLQHLKEETKRFYSLTSGWPPEERIRVLMGWMGTNRLRKVNDFLQLQQAKAGNNEDNRHG